jgi:hypothetical protein
MIRTGYQRGLLAVSLTLAVAMHGAAQEQQRPELRPIQIDRAVVQPAGSTALFGDIAYEDDREIRVGAPFAGGRSYDNFRLGPLGVRHGVGNNLEVGGYLTYNSNSANDDGAPDNSGLEGLSLYGKMQLNQHFALKVGTTFVGKDDVAPYPNDGIDFFVNLPMQRQLGNGLLFGEFGYTVQDQDIGGSYFNYGIGYAFRVGNTMNASVELAGDENPIGSNHMSLIGGLDIALARGMRVAPYISLGLYDPSPDVAVGAQFELAL